MADQPQIEPYVEKHPGMMGDGTEEQNLNQKGNPAARITEDEVKEAFKDMPADTADKQ